MIRFDDEQKHQGSQDITYAVIMYMLASLFLPFSTLCAKIDILNNSIIWYFLWPPNYLYYIQFDNANAPHDKIGVFIRSMGIFGFCSVFYAIARVKIQASYESIEIATFVNLVKCIGFALFFIALGILTIPMPYHGIATIDQKGIFLLSCILSSMFFMLGFSEMLSKIVACRKDA